MKFGKDMRLPNTIRHAKFGLYRETGYDVTYLRSMIAETPNRNQIELSYDILTTEKKYSGH